MTVINAILSNFVMIFELIGLLIILRISVHIPKKNKTDIFTTIILLFVSAIVYNIELWTQSFETLSVFRPILTYIKYSLYPLILIVLLHTYINKNKQVKMGYRILLWAPEIVAIPIYFTSQYTKLVCYYTEDNKYLGGPLSRLPYIIFIFYLVLFIAQNVLALKNYSKSTRWITFYISVGAFVGIVLYMIFGYEADYTPVFTSSLVLYFIFLYIHMASIDPLTSLMNRQGYYQAITHYSDSIYGVVSIDMNDLKFLNDNYGHDEGDKALVTVASIFLQYSGDKGTVYRVGGDEFMIFYTKIEESEIQEHIRIMIEKLQETKYVCAFGYAMKDENTNIEEVIRISDERMYKNKAMLKAQKNTNE